jgi:hypothetical protein
VSQLLRLCCDVVYPVGCGMADSKAYSNQLRDPRWQKKRLEILSRDNFSCQICGNEKETLMVHHRYYIQNREPWDYPENLLVTLCSSCHENEHELEDEANDLVRILKSNSFFNSDISELCRWFNCLNTPPLPYPAHVFVSALVRILNDNARFEKFMSDYFLEIKKNVSA